MDKQEYFEKAYAKAKRKGYTAREAKRIALTALKYWTPDKKLPEIKPVKGKRSLAVNSNFTQNGNIIDVLVGYPDSMAEQNIVDSLDMSGFENFKEKEVYADLEHFHFDFANGVKNDLDEKWHTFLMPAKLYKVGNEIRAKVEIPDTERGKEFLKKYKSGKYGASIEYQGVYTDENKITNWEITGFSFTKNPHYNQTKPKNTENQSNIEEK